jgi:hypothetical protein
MVQSLKMPCRFMQQARVACGPPFRYRGTSLDAAEKLEKSGRDRAHPRPETLNGLFVEGTPYENWRAFNWKQRRFFLKDARLALGLLQVPHTIIDKEVKIAANIIQEKTEWSREYIGEFTVSKTQLYPSKIIEPKFVDKAATIIVALSVIAEQCNRNVDIYDIVKIVPAYFFIDGISPAFIRNLEEEWKSNGRTIAKELDQEPATSIDSLWAAHLGEVSSATGLLRDIARGCCITQFLANKLQGFLLAFGHNLRVLHAGQDGSEMILGTKAAAPSITPNLIR